MKKKLFFFSRAFRRCERNRLSAGDHPGSRSSRTRTRHHAALPTQRGDGCAPIFTAEAKRCPGDASPCTPARLGFTSLLLGAPAPWLQPARTDPAQHSAATGQQPRHSPTPRPGDGRRNFFACCRSCCLQVN